MFCDWDVDLFIFLDGCFSDKVFVDGKSGAEEMYCGLEKAPCLSVNYGMERLKRTLNIKQEIILCTKSTVTGCADVSGISLKAKTDVILQIECQREVSGSQECVLKSSSHSYKKFIGIVVPSSFNRSVKFVVDSNRQNYELHVKNCVMSVVGGKC
ncbi:uncharacterized protein MONOS_15114 [Monocercomonoides exilis]|uniref:uncharacterized protein n=1 Tax=Monocercomonoides exilis TaxID=2049356 RepID=UPI00355ACA44|nr:hypothetical protein MONOS_15114 [Monocercomonoides exilis]|eukprot:MONOS_15114.1-p1 / transcript=MONOS_15114.1 / gene=MONOS_15114 / organism=Monocercomonoides_exilis_PA203 / gene_product=unspecified product / transcript_product=unspecified product / location=Mono_scaffold01147:15367-15831(+) / protein_length=155 / sequence_SO=supercontig / SO=protein_coding / is_pseudo=false